MNVVLMQAKTSGQEFDKVVKVTPLDADEEFCDKLLSQAVRLGLKNILIEQTGFIGDDNYSYRLNTLLEILNNSTIKNSRCHTDNLTIYIWAHGKTVSEDFLDKLERYVRTPQMTSVNHFFGDVTDPITDKFINNEKKALTRKLFRDYLAELIDTRGYRKNSDVYKASGISKSTYSKIMSYKEDHKPSKDTVAALAIGLKLNMEETQELYHSAGFHLGTTDFVDRVVKFFIEEKRYDIDEVNYCLELWGYPPLGEKLRDVKVKVQ